MVTLGGQASDYTYDNPCLLLKDDSEVIGDRYGEDEESRRAEDCGVISMGLVELELSSSMLHVPSMNREVTNSMRANHCRPRLISWNWTCSSDLRLLSSRPIVAVAPHSDSWSKVVASGDNFAASTSIVAAPVVAPLMGV